MACKYAVVGTNMPCLSEIGISDNNYMLFEAQCINELCYNMEKLLDENDLIAKYLKMFIIKP